MAGSVPADGRWSTCLVGVLGDDPVEVSEVALRVISLSGDIVCNMCKYTVHYGVTVL